MKRMLTLLVAGSLLAAAGEAFAESSRDFALEVKFGPWYPERVDREAALGGQTPFADSFGTDHRLLPELEFDWQFFQGHGSLGVGGSLGYTRASGKGFYAADAQQGLATTTRKSRDKTAFTLIPLGLVIVYRWDWAAITHGIPLVPYAKLGFDYYLWWVTDASGDLSKGAKGNDKAIGGIRGVQFRPGVQFLLDWLDSRTALDFDRSSGVNNSYLFFEAGLHLTDDWGGSSLDLSHITWQAGLLLEI